MRWWGDHLNSGIHQGESEKFYSYGRGITKNFQNLKNFQKPPLPVKNDTSLKAIAGKQVAYHGCNLPKMFTVYDTTEKTIEKLILCMHTKLQELAMQQYVVSLYYLFN